MKNTKSIFTRLTVVFSLLQLVFVGANAQNNAVHLDGVNDYVEIGAPKTIPESAYSYNFERTNPFSLELWIKPESGGTLISRISEIHQSGYKGYELSLGSDGKLLGQLVSNLQAGNAIVVRSNASVPMDGKWHHVAMTYNGSSKASGVTLYIDGLAVGATIEKDALTETIAQNAGIRLGLRLDALSQPSAMYKGALDDMRIWKVAVSASDIKARMNTELAGNEPNLANYVSFNQGTPGGNNAGLAVIPSKPDASYSTSLRNFALTGNTSNYIGVQTVCTRQ